MFTLRFNDHLLFVLVLGRKKYFPSVTKLQITFLWEAVNLKVGQRDILHCRPRIILEF